MNVSPNELRKETVRTLKDVESVLESVKRDAGSRGVLVDDRGHYVMAPLLLAKATCLNTLTLLNEQR